MRIYFNRKGFLRLFKIAASVCPVRDVKPVFCCVKIVAEKDKGIVLLAEDGVRNIRVPVGATASEEGEVIVPAKQFQNCLAKLKLDSVMLTVADGQIVLSDGRGRAPEQVTLPVMDTSDDIKSVAEFSAESYYTIQNADLQQIVQRTIFAADKDDAVLSGVLFESEPGINGRETLIAVATNKRHMAIQRCNADCVGTSEIAKKWVPVKTLQLVVKVLKSSTALGIKMAVDSETVTFCCGDVIIVSRLLHGRLGWRTLIPNNGKAVKATVKADELSSVVQNIAVLKDKWTAGIWLTFGDNRLTVEDEMRKVRLEIPVVCTGSIALKVDPRFLMGVLKVFAPGTVLSWEMHEDDPVKITVGDFCYLVMPMSS